jgi:ribonuclease J
MIRIAPGSACVVETVPSGRLALEGARLVQLDGELVRGRVRGLFNGTATVTIVIDETGALVADAQISTTGLLEPDDFDFEDSVLDVAEAAVDNLSKKARLDDDQVAETVRIAVRRHFRSIFNKNPVTKVHLVRV